MKAKVEKLGIAKTLKAAAGRTGLNETQVQRVKDSGSEAFRANGTVDCDRLLEDAIQIPDVGGDDVLDFRLEKAKDMRANRMLKEQKLKERDKLLWPIDSARRAWARNVIACKTKLYGSENGIATEAQMKLNLTADQAAALREIVMKHQRLAIKELFAGEWGDVKCPNCNRDIKHG